MKRPKWMLDDPRIKFAIPEGGARLGIDHLGQQVDSSEQLVAVRAQWVRADNAKPTSACCT